MTHEEICDGAEAETRSALKVPLRIPTDLFLVQQAAAVAAKLGLNGENVIVDLQDEPTPEGLSTSSAIVRGTPTQMATFEDVLTIASRASVGIMKSTDVSNAAYEGAMRDVFHLQEIRLGLAA
jgi:hypothetical protein